MNSGDATDVLAIVFLARPITVQLLVAADEPVLAVSRTQVVGA